MGQIGDACSKSSQDVINFILLKAENSSSGGAGDISDTTTSGIS